MTKPSSYCARHDTYPDEDGPCWRCVNAELAKYGVFESPREPARAHLCNALAVIQLKDDEWSQWNKPQSYAEAARLRDDAMAVVEVLRSRIERAVLEIDAGNTGGGLR